MKHKMESARVLALLTSVAVSQRITSNRVAAYDFPFDDCTVGGYPNQGTLTALGNLETLIPGDPNTFECPSITQGDNVFINTSDGVRFGNPEGFFGLRTTELYETAGTDLANGFSFSTWLFLDDNPSGFVLFELSQTEQSNTWDGGNDNQFDIQLELAAADTLSLQISNPGAATGVTTRSCNFNEQFVPAQLHHLTVTADSNSMDCYVNGTSVASIVGFPEISVQDDRVLTIGGGFGTGSFPPFSFGGTMFYVALYDRVLSSTEVTTNFNAGLQEIDNSPPRMVDISIFVTEDEVLVIPLDNATLDFDNLLLGADDQIVYYIQGPPSRGTLSTDTVSPIPDEDYPFELFPTDTLSYTQGTPNADTGTDSVTISVSSSDGLSNAAIAALDTRTITITYVQANDVPVVAAGRQVASKQSETTSLTLTATDPLDFGDGVDRNPDFLPSSIVVSLPDPNVPLVLGEFIDCDTEDVFELPFTLDTLTLTVTNTGEGLFEATICFRAFSNTPTDPTTGTAETEFVSYVAVDGAGLQSEPEMVSIDIVNGLFNGCGVDAAGTPCTQLIDENTEAFVLLQTFDTLCDGLEDGAFIPPSCTDGSRVRTIYLTRPLPNENTTGTLSYEDEEGEIIVLTEEMFVENVANAGFEGIQLPPGVNNLTYTPVPNFINAAQAPLCTTNDNNQCVSAATNTAVQDNFECNGINCPQVTVTSLAGRFEPFTHCPEEERYEGGCPIRFNYRFQVESVFSPDIDILGHVLWVSNVYTFSSRPALGMNPVLPVYNMIDIFNVAIVLADRAEPMFVFDEDKNARNLKLDFRVRCGLLTNCRMSLDNSVLALERNLVNRFIGNDLEEDCLSTGCAGDNPITVAGPEDIVNPIIEQFRFLYIKDRFESAVTLRVTLGALNEFAKQESNFDFEIVVRDLSQDDLTLFQRFQYVIYALSFIFCCTWWSKCGKPYLYRRNRRRKLEKYKDHLKWDDAPKDKRSSLSNHSSEVKKDIQVATGPVPVLEKVPAPVPKHKLKASRNKFKEAAAVSSGKEGEQDFKCWKVFPSKKEAKDEYFKITPLLPPEWNYVIQHNKKLGRTFFYYIQSNSGEKVYSLDAAWFSHENPRKPEKKSPSKRSQKAPNKGPLPPSKDDYDIDI